MSARGFFMRIGLVALAATHVWCASESDDTTPPPPAGDGGADAGAPNDAAPPGEDASLPEVPVCNDAFCRVSVPGAETIALDGVLAKSASDVWVVGSTGFAARFDGTSWRHIQTNTRNTIFAIAGSGDGTVWGASGGDSFLVLSREADGGVEVVDGHFDGVVRAIGTVGTREAWAVGDAFSNFFDDPPPPVDFIWRYGPDTDGGAWAWQPVSPPCPPGEFGQPSCMKLNAVWVESAERVWFAGDEGKVFRADTTVLAGGGEEPPPRLELVEMNSSSLRKLNALWGFGANDVWAVGAQGVIRHWVGPQDGADTWTIVPSPVTADLNGVWGTRPDDVWAVGDDGVVLHWDGKEWTLVPTPFAAENRPRLYAVSGAGSDIWIAGEGTLLRSANTTGGDR